MDAFEKVYCLFCETGREKNVEIFLREHSLNVIKAHTERHVYKSGRRVKTELRPLFPGYVFFTGVPPINWQSLRHKHIYRILRYTNGEHSLRGEDLECVRWLLRNGGTIRSSRVMEAGTKIRVIDGRSKTTKGA